MAGVIAAPAILLVISEGLAALLDANRPFHADQMARMRCLAADPNAASADAGAAPAGPNIL